jgi:LPS export ABC transporter protein LptC
MNRHVILSAAKDLLLLAALLVAAACQDNKQTPVTASAKELNNADQMFLGMRTILTTKGVQRAELLADTAYVLEDQTRFDLRKPHVNFTTEMGAPQGTMDSRKGMYSTRTQILEGWGDVVVKLVDGRMLKSPHIVYNQLTHLITSDTSYTVTDARGTQFGVGLTSNESFTSFSCARNCGGRSNVAIPEK